jgi:sugar phosphate permease
MVWEYGSEVCFTANGQILNWVFLIPITAVLKSSWLTSELVDSIKSKSVTSVTSVVYTPHIIIPAYTRESCLPDGGMFNILPLSRFGHLRLNI